MPIKLADIVCLNLTTHTIPGVPNMNIKECFEILEIKVDATKEEVNKAYRIIMMATHPDKIQGDPRLKAIAEEEAKEINIAREELVVYLNERRSNDKQDRITIEGGEDYGKVSDFFDENCICNGAGGSYHLDLYMVYRDWCSDKGLKTVSVDDLYKALDALKLVSIRKNSNGIDSIYWPGIEISKAWWFDDLDDPWNYDPHDDGMPREFPELKEYADVDDDDDLGEVVF